MFNNARQDLRAALERDPAARNRIEIMFCYPGLWAIWSYRINHFIWRIKFKLLARILSQFTRFITGIEIHPGARIGPGCFIDHGMGVVIGETTEIGADATIYQGATLGGTSIQKGKRHPTLGNCVVVGAGAKVLGAITIGDCARIGANAVVVKPAPAGAVIVGVPGEIITGQRGSAGKRRPNLNHNQLPDILGEAIISLSHRVEELEQRIDGHVGEEKKEGPHYNERQDTWQE